MFTKFSSKSAKCAVRDASSFDDVQYLIFIAVRSLQDYSPGCTQSPQQMPFVDAASGHVTADPRARFLCQLMCSLRPSRIVM